jgi:Domain of unknown function (DUF3471)
MASATTPKIVLLALLAGPSFAAADTPSPEGHWKGTVELPGQPLEVLVRIVSGEGQGGGWSGTIDIPAQGARNLTLSKFEVSPGAVRFSIAGVPGDPTFRGMLSSTTIVGDLTQGGQTFAFRLERSITGDVRAVNEKPKDESETHERKTGTKPAHALDEYVGDYSNPAYGKISVSRDETNGLKASIQNRPARLEHWHYETFRVIFEDPAFAGKTILVLFRANVDGDVDALEMPLEPETHPTIFEKKGRP